MSEFPISDEAVERVGELLNECAQATDSRIAQALERETWDEYVARRAVQAFLAAEGFEVVVKREPFNLPPKQRLVSLWKPKP